MGIVYSYGFNDKSRPAYSNGVRQKAYVLWLGLLRACYDEDFHKGNPTYKDCSVSDNFKSYSYFYDWCQRQIGFDEKDWQIDKDILVKGNKVYSEDVCVFIPSGMNKLLTKSTASRGTLLIGVSWHKRTKKYRARVSKDGKSFFIGYFDDQISAFMEYKKHKEDQIKKVAIANKDKLDDRAYNALISYKVEITD